MPNRFVLRSLRRPQCLPSIPRTRIPSALQRRGSHMQIAKLEGTVEPVYSSGEDVGAIASDTKYLLREHGGRWRLSDDRKGLEREFKFKKFKTTWEFMNLVAEQCAVQRHHPEWSNIYNRVFIRWTTHNPSGLSHRDVKMAKFCDDHAEQLGETASVSTSNSQGNSNGSNTGSDLSALAGNLKVGNTDCCSPQKTPA